MEHEPNDSADCRVVTGSSRLLSVLQAGTRKRHTAARRLQVARFEWTYIGFMASP